MELARGYWLGALGVLVFAKMLSVGVTAFIFDLTQPSQDLLSNVGSPARGPDIAAARAHPAADAGSLTAVRSGEGSADSQD